ncbi:MAG: putative penicillin acylase [Frankiales bacterium]|nr:putative penicillin acylase [Frankiales bacterium]
MSAVRRPGARAVLVTALAASLVGAGVAAGSAPAAATSGLPAVSSGHRPGPDILYAPPAKAPQLESTGIWKAEPILVSGAQSYRGGEWLYQDFLSDDHGATGSKDSNDPYGASGHLYSPAGGSFTYPTDKVYANNAADLVELRAKPLADATAFRVTLNTLIDPSRSAFTIALGSGAAVAWPHSAGVKSPGQVFVTWHGAVADLLDATGKALTPAPTASVDLARRQITVLIPHAAWNPGASKVHTTVGVGLWDRDGNKYLAPQPGAATATTPGGGTPNGVAIVNVGPRFNEPVPTFAGSNMADTAVGGIALAPWWRDRQQSEQLTQGDVSPFGADVDFAKLASGARDDSGVPTSGPMDRILASHYSFGQGLDPTKICFDLAASFNAGSKCIGRFIGQLQSYALYVPKKPVPAKGYGMTLLLHSLSANYNQYLASRNQSELGERGPGSLVVTPGGRGPDGFNQGIAEADDFETWADVARHYKVDADWSSVTGYSMGGFGTYRLLARWPDLFARGFSVVGEPASVTDQLTSLRNTPLLAWNSGEDELVNINTSENAVKANTAAGIRFEEDKFLTADHLTLAANDEYGPGVAFLGTNRVDRNPYHVTFVVDPTEDNVKATAVADHAYWLSDLKVRKPGDGTADAVSAAFGTTDAKVLSTMYGASALTGGEIPALAYVVRSQQWGPFGHAAKADALTLTLTNLRSATVDVQRAGLTCGAKLIVKTDGPVAVTLGGCGKTLHFG